MNEKSDKKTWHTMTAEEKARVIAWLRGQTKLVGVLGALPDGALDAAANELEHPTWGEGGDTW